MDVDDDGDMAVRASSERGSLTSLDKLVLYVDKMVSSFASVGQCAYVWKVSRRERGRGCCCDDDVPSVLME